MRLLGKLNRMLNIKFSTQIYKSDLLMKTNNQEQLDEKIEEVKMVQAMTAKEIKNKYRPDFEQYPEKYYPVNFFNKIGFVRKKCVCCGKRFWNINPDREKCADSSCEGSYTFIGEGVGIGKEKHVTYKDAWDTFEKSFTNARIPCTRIDRYPTVARWRNDVDYVAAGIYCFQPYCVTGEMAAPANPLICPQFCVRFNDLDNIGLTGRHYSGFVMIGIQVFNYPNEYHFFKEECVEFNYNWLTQELKIPVEEIVFTEDIWAGGGNMGPCIEYFVKGMEIGNMVFMQYKTFHDGSIEELKVKVIDTGIGLERIPWVLNGSPTSYTITFNESFKYITEKLDIQLNNEIWQKLGPYSCLLDVDECEDMDKTWQFISDKLGVEKPIIQKAIAPIRDIFIILDHTRSAMFLIKDGSLPSNVGGGSNLRNLVRRTFAIMNKNKWWEKCTFDDYLKIFEKHEDDMEKLYGKFPEYSSFNDILRLEYSRWATSDELQKEKLKKLLKKRKNKLEIKDWITAVTAWGLPADTIAELSKTPIPDNLYYNIAETQERIVKAAEQILYDTSHLPETVCLYLDHLKHLNPKKDEYSFEGKIIAVFNNVCDNNKSNIVILDQTSFYPTSGGQMHDEGTMTINDEEYKVVNVEKVGRVLLHTLDREVSVELVDTKVSGKIDQKRRIQLRNHHTSAHIIFAAATKVLGPHVWQQGAKKTTKQAHLDITHYSSLSKETELKIQEEANRIVMKSANIKKRLEMKDQAEKEHGFHLYQGGIVPGNELRIVEIEGIDIEACCGTHCDNTGEVGWIKIITSKRIADGVVRLYFVAGERTLEVLKEETEVIHSLSDMWSIPQNEIVGTAKRIFTEYKRGNTEISEAKKKILGLQVRIVTHATKGKGGIIKSTESDPTLYFSFLNNHAKELKNAEKAIVFYGQTFVFAFFPNKNDFNVDELKAKLDDDIKVNTRNVFGSKKNQVKQCLVVSLVRKTELKDVPGMFAGLDLETIEV